jgi:oxepin-CoA hydrolase/3-oxo-5,6-dehydrosuberyl-CoA semialdehyde dehydrogenase
MKTLESYVGGRWVAGTGAQATLVNPSTEEPVAQASTGGIDFAAALEHARTKGGPALREMTFAQRGEIVKKMSQAIHAARDELLALAIENAGNTRGDAKFDVDGASGTLMAYAGFAEKLGAARLLVDGEAIPLGRSPRLVGAHAWAPRHGVAVHVNAFNFPAWGFAEKAAVAILAGMPVVTKPATATAVVAERIVRLLVDAKVLPEGALSLVCGSAGDLLSHLGAQDVLAFTGSSDTAARLRAAACFVSGGARINVEADSLNAAILGPDVADGSETEGLFLEDVARDMTQKAGQKCTAIRRVLVPSDRADRIAAALAERLSAVVVGNPADERVRMGPVATAQQLSDVRAGIDRLAAETDEGWGGTGQVDAVGAPAGKGFFVGPVLRRTSRPLEVRAMNEHEVFGPVATLGAFSGEASEAAEIVRKGQGALVASVYSDDRTFLSAFVPAIAPWHGRVFVGSAKVAGQSPGPGTVLPAFTHGGPGRAGGGEELGGTRGLSFYMQRTALQGDQALLRAILGTAE